MPAWVSPLLDALARGEAAVLVHLAIVEGSAPRDAGTTMLVTEAGICGTIGGGELEALAIREARSLAEAGRSAIRAVPLGPALGQCCGGAVTLAYEPFAPADRAWLVRLAQAAAGPEPVFRTVELDAAGSLSRDWHVRSPLAPLPSQLARSRAGAAADVLTITEHVNPQPMPLWLFGAGHVGRAVAAALAPLGFALTWIDGRAGQFPDPPPPGVHILELAMPELIVDDAPPGTAFLVMTHSHPLDEAICAAVLHRGDFAYLGLIGSASKRARFRARLAAQGFAPVAVDRLVCPIGLPTIVSKEPAAIAASVAADLLIHRERDFARPMRAGPREELP